MKNNICPVCGSESNAPSNVSRLVSVDHYQSFPITYSLVKCDACGYSGSNSDSSDTAVDVAKKESDLVVLRKLIDDIGASGTKASYIERVFHLPPKTLNRWRSQGGSAASVALMKLIRTYSWLPIVAENGYEPRFARDEQYKQAAIQFNSERSSMGVSRLTAYAKIFGQEGNGFFSMTAFEDSSSSKSDDDVLVIGSSTGSLALPSAG